MTHTPTMGETPRMKENPNMKENTRFFPGGAHKTDHQEDGKLVCLTGATDGEVRMGTEGAHEVHITERWMLKDKMDPRIMENMPIPGQTGTGAEEEIWHPCRETKKEETDKRKQRREEESDKEY